MAISEQQREELQHRMSVAAGTAIDAQLLALDNRPHPTKITDHYERLVFAYSAIAEYAICQARYALERKDNDPRGIGAQLQTIAETLCK